jgi:sulfur-carrier protein
MDASRAAKHAGAVAVLEWTSHLKTLFPVLGNGPLSLRAETVADAISELERTAPGIAFYVCDELGRLRRHVNIFVDGEMIMDRQRLSDRLGDESRVFIAQALSGG